MHKAAMPPAIFDRHARRLARDRMASAAKSDRWIVDRMADELLDRLTAVRRSFDDILLIGDLGRLRAALASDARRLVSTDSAPRLAGGFAREEDRLDFAAESFDLILSANGLDTVDDLPGALILARRTLRPGGLFMAAMAGPGGLTTLRTCLPPDGVARFHPQIDVRAAGDLLGRAGFALPVADVDLITARYADLDRLASDLRANGLRNVMATRSPLGRARWEAARQAFAARAVGSKTDETIALLYLTGWAGEGPVAAPDRR